MAQTKIREYLHRLHELQERTTNTVLGETSSDRLKWVTSDGGGAFTINDTLRMWTWHFWTHHRDLIMARGRLIDDNPHFHVPHHVREANEAFGRFIGELACLTDEQLEQRIPGGRSIREVIEHVLTTLDGYFDAQVREAKPSRSTNASPTQVPPPIPELVPATEADFAVVTNLSRLYVYDMSAYMGWACPENGLFGGCDEFFDGWRAGKARPYLIRVAGELAGFAAVKPMDGNDRSYMQEFFVLGKFRRKGVGRQVAQELFARHPGHWEVEQLLGNTPAVLFWRRVIADHTSGRYSERLRQSPWGPMNAIEFVT